MGVFWGWIQNVFRGEEVSDCDILRHHDSRIMTYHDCENHHVCHILKTFGTNKQAVVYKILSNTCHCTILMVVDVMETLQVLLEHF